MNLKNKIILLATCLVFIPSLVFAVSTTPVAKGTNIEYLLYPGDSFGIGNTSPGELLSLGTAGTTKGVLSLSGNTSGKVIIQPAAAAGTYTLTLPTDDGTSNQFLQTNGSGVLTWATASGGGGSPAGSTGDIQFNTSSAFDADTGILFYDKTNHRQGWGTNAPDAQGHFHLAGTTLAPPSFFTGISSLNTSNYFAGDTITYRIYCSSTFLGSRYYSATYIEHSIGISNDGDTPSIEFGSGCDGDSVVILRDINSGGFNDATITGGMGTFIDDNSQPWADSTAVTPTSVSFDTRTNYYDGTNLYGLQTTGNGYVGGKLGLGIVPTVKFEVLGSNATIPTMGLPYESAAFFNLDNKVGIYSNQTSLAGNGSSITFGEAYATNGLGQYPGFEIQNVNASTPAASYLRFNSLVRDSGGNVVASVANILTLFADGHITTVGGNTLDNGSGGTTVASLTDSALTSGRVTFAGTSGLLTDDSDMTFATDTLTVTKIAATTFTGNVTLSTKNLITDTTTGTKIGTATTQKLGFFNATPIVQVANTTEIGVALSNLGLRASGTAYPITTSGAVTLGSLTATRVPFAGTAGLLGDDAGFLFTSASDQLTLGESGTDGSLKIFSEDGATDHSTIFNPGLQTQDIVYTLPVNDGNASQVLQTDGSGVLSWATSGSSQWTTTGSDIYYMIGKVGIGLNNPANPLQVKQNFAGSLVQLNNTTAWSGSEYSLDVTGYSLLGGMRINGADGPRVLYLDSGQMGFGANNNIITFETTIGNESARFDTSGRFGIGVNSPTAFLHLKAGTATASTAPLKFNSGTLLTAPEAGATEFLTDGLYFTRTTGAIRENIPLVQTGRATAQTAANTSVVTYTPTVDSSYLISANVLVTTATIHSFTATVDYTDEGNTARTVTLQFSTLAGAFVTAMTNAQGAVPYEGVPLHIRAKANTAITIKTAGTFTTVTYNVEGSITKIN